MYVCTYIHVYVYVYICRYVHIYTCTHICTYMYIYVCLCVCVCVCLYTCEYIYIYMYTHTHAHKYWTKCRYVRQLQYAATRCNKLNRLKTHCSALQHVCNTLRYTATQIHAQSAGMFNSRNTLAMQGTHYSTLRHCNTLQHTATRMQHTATHCNTNT